jgi:predicted amidohydrolase
VLLLSGGRVVDPASGFDGAADVLIDGGSVRAIGASLARTEGPRSSMSPA